MNCNMCCKNQRTTLVALSHCVGQVISGKYLYLQSHAAGPKAILYNGLNNFSHGILTARHG